MKHQVGDWMTKHPVRIAKNEDIKVAQEIMHQEAIRHILVFDRGDGQVAGVLTENDLKLAEHIRKRFKDFESRGIKITVGDLMSREPLTISSTSNMDDAIRVMSQNKFHSLPVVDQEKKCVGILTSTDVMRYALVATQRASLESNNLSVLKFFGL